MAGLLDTIKEKAKQVYGQGLLNQVITNPASVGQEISQLFDPSYMRNIKPMTQEQATSTALDINPMLTFIGKGSKLWNPKNEQLFTQLEKKGLQPEEIWKQTGTLRGVDKKLRQEISDVGSSVTDNVYEGIVKNKRFEGKIGDALSHPELYKSYPDTANIGTGMYAWKTPEGSYDAVSRTITAGGPGTTSQKSALLHEIQHDIQNTENFARGGSPENFPSLQDVNDAQIVSSLIKKGNLPSEAMQWVKNNLGRTPSVSSMDLATKQNVDLFNIPTNINQYKRLAGEAEARLTQSRMKLTPEERLKYFPYNEGQYGLDVPLNELIVKGLLK